MCGWIKGDSWDSGTNVDVIARKGEGNPNNYQLAIADGLATLYFDEGDGGGYRGDTLLNTGQWYHIAATWDGTTVRIYVDGVLDNAPPDSHGGTIGTDTRPFYMGGRSGSDLFDGTLDDVRVYSRALTAEEIQMIMRGPLGPASHPNPADMATDVPRDVILSWTPGEFASPVNGHKVYLSENFSDVNDRVGGITQDANSYAPPQRLNLETTYYWCVDEVNAPPDFTIFEGDVWSFTVEPFAYTIAGTSITVTASSQFNEKQGPEKTINGSGLDDNDLHSTEDEDTWLSSMTGPQPTWIQYEFDRVYKLHQMWVWNYNTPVEPAIGFGIKDATIEYSTDGANWATLGTTHEFARAPGTDGYAYNTTVDLSGVPAKYVKITANSNWGGLLPQYGLSEVRFLHISVVAREPDPASGATDVPVATIGQAIDVTLSFRAGREAASHNVYLSIDEQAVIDETISAVSVPVGRSYTSYNAGSLELDQTYYWKVNEVNEAETPTTWQGDVWNFSTQKYLVVDDFEDYNDFEPDRVFDTWIDGWGVPENGSQVGYDMPPFVEETIVYGGDQSMPFSYDNTGGVAYSEAESTFAIPQDWTVRGVKALTLWFRGNPVAFQESPPGTFTMSADGADIWDTADEFRYAYKQLSGDGSIVAQVLSVQNTDNFAKAGVMIRNTLDADSANAMAFITPSGRVGWQHRLRAGMSSNSTRSDEGAITAPHWVKLSRQGNTITAQHSSDGVNWEPMVEVGTQEPTSMDIPMNPDVYVGLALTSHNAGVICEAKFSDVATTGAVTGQWQVAEIGVAQPSNTAAPLYVALADSTGKSAEIKHPNPAATTIGTWTEWNIDLAEFTGVNPRSIKKMIIGVGDKANPQPASGLVYCDDIRLYP